MQATAYTASFDASGKFTKVFHTDPSAARADGRERAAAGHFQAKVVSFDGNRLTLTTAIITPATVAHRQNGGEA